MVHYWGHRRAARLLRGATGALTLTKPYRSTAIVVPLLAPVAHRQKFLSMFKNFYHLLPLLILSPMSCRCATVLTDVILLRGHTSTDPRKSTNLCSGIAPASKSVRCDSALTHSKYAYKILYIFSPFLNLRLPNFHLRCNINIIIISYHNYYYKLLEISSKQI